MVNKMTLNNLSNIWNIYKDIETGNQKISSAKTARVQVPRTFKVIKLANLIKNGKMLLDIGCGNGNKEFSQEAELLGFDYNGCDPYNKTKEDNLQSIKKCMEGNTDLVTLNNVLNTIAEKESRLSVLAQADNALNKESGILLVLIYEGQKISSEVKKEKETGIKLKELTPIETRDGFQNRMKTEMYVSEVKEVFANVSLLSVDGVKLIAASQSEELDIVKILKNRN